MVTLELGGKNPMIVFPDVDLAKVAKAAVEAMNLRREQGQSCGSPSRILVHASIRPALVDAITEHLSAFRVGDPLHETMDMGPLAFRDHYERVCGYVEAGSRDGARLVVGGERPEGLERGFYLAPTLFDEASLEMAIAREEIFGPVISVLDWQEEA